MGSDLMTGYDAERARNRRGKLALLAYLVVVAAIAIALHDSRQENLISILTFMVGFFATLFALVLAGLFVMFWAEDTIKTSRLSDN